MSWDILARRVWDGMILCQLLRSRNGEPGPTWASFECLGGPRQEEPSMMWRSYKFVHIFLLLRLSSEAHGICQMLRSHGWYESTVNVKDGESVVLVYQSCS